MRAAGDCLAEINVCGGVKCLFNNVVSGLFAEKNTV